MTITADTAPAKAKPIVNKASPQETAKPRLQPIARKHCALVNFKHNAYYVAAPEHLTVEDFENPDLWSHACQGWLLHDRIEIAQPRRLTEAVVVDTGPGYARVLVLWTRELPEQTAGAAQTLPVGYSIRRGFPDELPKFVVVRDADGFAMNLNHPSHTTFEEARRWLLDLNIFKK